MTNALYKSHCASLLVPFLAAILCCVVTSPARADSVPDSGAFSYNGTGFTVLNVPGFADPFPKGVNNAGQIVGTDGDGNLGFLYNNGAVQPIAPPGATDIRPTAINDLGQIVGYDFSGGWHGFLDSAGTFTSLTAPGSLGFSTDPNGINDSGEIVGSFENSPFGSHGFLYHKGAFTEIDAPGAVSTQMLGINDSGQAFGEETGISGSNYFLYNLHTGVFSNINVPCAGARILGMNDSGRMVGICNFGQYSFDYNYHSGKFTSLTFPLSYTQQTFAAGISDNGEIVGAYAAPEAGTILLSLADLSLLGLAAFTGMIVRPKTRQAQTQQIR